MIISNELESCISLMKSENHTVVLSRNGEVLTSRLRGVKPLLDFLDRYGTLKDFSAADKVVGRAAAFIYALLEIKELYAITVSDGACGILQKYGIKYFYEDRVPLIRNRTNTDSCPMEKATQTTDSPEKAVRLIRDTLEKLKN